MSEYRYDPLIDRTVILAPARAARPRAFLSPETMLPSHECPFCEGREDQTPGERYAVRGNGSLVDGPGWSLRVVPNLYPALCMDGPNGAVPDSAQDEGMSARLPGVGEHEVIVETPRHVTSLTDLTDDEAITLFAAMRARIVALSADPRLAFVSLFKNVGRMAGASIEHAHSQLLATSIVPAAVERELAAAQRAHDTQSGCGFCAHLGREIQYGARIVAENHEAVSLAPLAPRLPFETWILPRVHAATLGETSAGALAQVALLTREAVARLERLFPGVAYNLAICSAPLRPTLEQTRAWHWRVELVPRMGQLAGFEWGTGLYVNVVTPEQAAERMRAASLIETGTNQLEATRCAERRERVSLARME